MSLSCNRLITIGSKWSCNSKSVTSSDNATTILIKLGCIYGPSTLNKPATNCEKVPNN